MPIRETGLPWVFIPSLSTTSKALLIAEMQLMVRYFTLAHGCKSNSYVFTYINEVKEKIKLSDLEYEHFIEQLGDDENKESILLKLSSSVNGSRQKNYCRDALNNIALHIRNETRRDDIITNMLNRYIDEKIDILLR